jgi:hypothetical protein
MYGAIVGYEGLITKNPVDVYLDDKGRYVFKDMNSEFFNTGVAGFSNDGSYFYFISTSEREVNIYLQGIITLSNVLKEILNIS